jgi:PRC-barrel domain
MEPTTYAGWLDAEVQDCDGAVIGRVDHLVYDDRTCRPEFLGVTTRLFGSGSILVPIGGTRWIKDHLVVPFERHFLEDAPNIDDGWNLTPDEERRLFRHFGLDEAGGDYGRTARADAGFPVGEMRTRAATDVRLRRYRVPDCTRPS